MKRNNKIALFLLFLMFNNLNFLIPKDSSANISYVTISPYSGGLIPKENVTLSLISADVLIDVDMFNLNIPGRRSYNANYTIFNPGEAVNITIGAPFCSFQAENCTVCVNGTSISFDVINDYQIDYDNNEFAIWNQYLYNRSNYQINPWPYLGGFWILCNISVPQNSYLNLEYEFYSPQRSRYFVEGYYNIIYDVGTARLWEGNITESVVINIHGHLPHHIYEEQSCLISDISDGKIYQWGWDNERVEVNFVGLYYYFNDDDYYNPLYYTIKISLMAVPTLLGVGLVLGKKYYRKRSTNTN